jgi:hypothetical protein
MDDTRDALRTHRDDIWEALLRRLQNSEGYALELLPVARLARSHAQLGLLFPFQSLNRLCFSRCSEYPYTNDCPCIGVDRRGMFGVTGYPYYFGPAENDPRPALPLPRDAAHAIEIAAAALPPTAGEVWLGSSDIAAR